MGLLGKSLQGAGKLAWDGFQAVNTRLPETPAAEPSWAPAPLLKSRERSKPPLGFPRETDSLCPTCVIEARRQILEGTRDVSELRDGHLGEIKAQLYEDEQGCVRISKTCPKHGRFEDLLSIDSAFNRKLESRFRGRDFRTLGDESIHDHGTSSIRYGRGGVLTIDLTNRCNMMCEPCFTDANQVGYVHELTMEEVRKILDDSVSFKPHRQMSVQFSGGEPTLSPHFLDACRYARKLGYVMVQAATNGIRFALEPDFARQAKDAGLDMAYLQFDGVTNEANAHRHVTNLFDVRLRAIDNMAAAGIRIIPVVTVIRGVNDHLVGDILQFCMDHHDKVDGPAFQPVSFTGRDEEISDEDRKRRRYTTSHLARDLQKHFDGRIDPLRDWFPLGAGTALASLLDHTGGPDAAWGHVACSCHPDCGACVLLVRNKRTGEWATLPSFFDLDAFLSDIDTIVDSGRGRALSQAQVAASLLRNFDESRAPEGLTSRTLVDIVRTRLGGAKLPPEGPAAEWQIMWFATMWFQDLWTYDFRRTEMCVIPYGTEQGEISFCAYNTGAGWRHILEPMNKVATTREWFETRGRHTIYAGDRPIPLEGRPPGAPCGSCHGGPRRE